jgi:nucleoside-diphosphate-sugar epimerase
MCAHRCNPSSVERVAAQFPTGTDQRPVVRGDVRAVGDVVDVAHRAVDPAGAVVAGGGAGALGGVLGDVAGQGGVGDLPLPNHGMETVQHVHADDGYAEAVAGWFGRAADLEFLPWEQWRGAADPEDARVTLDHLSHGPHCSIDKGRELPGHQPRYSPLDAVREALDHLVATGVVAPELSATPKRLRAAPLHRIRPRTRPPEPAAVRVRPVQPNHRRAAAQRHPERTRGAGGER